jgi:hypothetical protein
MTTITREMLSAYIDDEVSREDRAQIEAALVNDDAMRHFVEQQRALRKGLADAFSPILSEALPDNLTARLKQTSSLGAQKPEPFFARLFASLSEKTTLTWLAPAGAVAAAAIVAVMIGNAMQPASLIVTADAGLEASPYLATALNEQLAADDGAAKSSGVHIGLTFATQTGDICRTFSGDDPERGGIAGIACRTPQTWRVTALANAEATSDPNLYRPAGSAMPAIIREAVGDIIAGEPFDASAEQRAKESGWLNTSR